VVLSRYRDLTGEEPVHLETGLTFGDLRIWREIEREPPETQGENSQSEREKAIV
jgi:hypothetical protein